MPRRRTGAHVGNKTRSLLPKVISTQRFLTGISCWWGRTAHSSSKATVSYNFRWTFHRAKGFQQANENTSIMHSKYLFLSHTHNWASESAMQISLFQRSGELTLPMVYLITACVQLWLLAKRVLHTLIALHDLSWKNLNKIQAVWRQA